MQTSIGFELEAARCHEAEDADNIPSELLCPDKMLGPRSPEAGVARELPCLYRARDESRRQGKRPLQMTKNDLAMLSIKARRQSFENDDNDVRGDEIENQDAGQADRRIRSAWNGPCPKTMAMAGFRRISSERAECAYCKLVVRNWQREDDPWLRHKCLSPCCRRLRQVSDAGIHRSADGKKQLRHSYSSYHDLAD